MRYVDPNGEYTWEAFENDLKLVWQYAIVPDFGADYLQLSYQAYNEGHYFYGCIYELDAFCEMSYDCLLAYGCADLLGKLASSPFGVAVAESISMLYKTASALNSKATIVLGRYKEGVCDGYIKFANKIGAKYFQLPAKLYNVLENVKLCNGKTNLAKVINDKWLNGVMKSGARILLNFDPGQAPAGSAHAMEIEILRTNEYTFQEVAVDGIKCWEALKSD